MKVRTVVVATVLGTLALSACVVRNDPPPGVALEPVELIVDCEPPLVFDDETTMAELGLADMFPELGEFTTRTGQIRITRAMVAFEDYAGPDVPAVVPEGQLLCATWEDGSGMTIMLREPFGIAVEAPADAADELPVTPILVGAILLLVALSWMAFRRDAPPAA